MSPRGTLVDIGRHGAQIATLGRGENLDHRLDVVLADTALLPKRFTLASPPRIWELPAGPLLALIGRLFSEPSEAN